MILLHKSITCQTDAIYVSLENDNLKNWEEKHHEKIKKREVKAKTSSSAKIRLWECCKTYELQSHPY
jgi:hypothetical protein